MLRRDCLKYSPAIVRAYFIEQGLPDPEMEYKFALEQERQFRFDFAFLPYRVALEVEGALGGIGKPCHVCGRRQPGAHGTSAGVRRDMEKGNLAIQLGWRVLRCEVRELTKQKTVDLIKAAIRWEAVGPKPIHELKLPLELSYAEPAKVTPF